LKSSLRIICAVLVLSLLLTASACLFGGGTSARCAVLNDSDFFAKYYTNQIKYDYLLEGFNFTDEEKAKHLRSYDALLGAKLCIEVFNKSNSDIRVIGLEIKHNGRKETLISTMPRAVVQISAKSEGARKVWFDLFADGGNYTNENILDMARGMGLKIIYVDAATDIRSLRDADVESLKYIKVK
jgi:hypothetical protein